MKERKEKLIDEYRKKCYFSCVESEKTKNFDVNIFNCTQAEYKYCNLFTDYHFEEIKSFPLQQEKGLKKYLDLLPLKRMSFSYGEGSTPLRKAVNYGKKNKLSDLFVKDEGHNPTGSFKDRKSVINVNVALDLGIEEVYSITSGNAGISLSFYCCPNRIKSVHFLINPKRELVLEERFIELSGGKVKRDIAGIREMLRFGPKDKRWNCTPGFDPIGVEGYKTISWEIWEQLEKTVPDVVVVPVGSGGGLFGVYKGFADLKNLSLTDKIPEIWSVEPSECPIVTSALETNNARFELENGSSFTYADHLMLNFKPSLPLVLNALNETRGHAINVSNLEIKKALKDIIKTEGLIPEPSSATVFAGIEKNREYLQEKSVVAILTGSGLKCIEEISHIVQREVKSHNEVMKTLKDGTKVLIKDADLSCIPDILSIQHEIVEENRYSFFTHRIRYEEEIGFFNRLESNEKIVMAYLGNQAIGYCVIVNYVKYLGSSSHIAEIGTFVRRNFRERGLGNIFVALLIDFAGINQYEKMVLEVRASNTRAIRLYEKYGFTTVAYLKDYYKNGGIRDDKILMERSPTKIAVHKAQQSTGT